MRLAGRRRYRDGECRRVPLRDLSAPAARHAGLAGTDVGFAAVELAAPAAIAGADLHPQALHGLREIALEAAAAGEHTRGGLEEMRLDELHGPICIARKDR